jgi:hypothetical protein
MDELAFEVRKIYRLLEYLRRNENGKVEFGITTCKGNIEWFPYYRLPYEAEKYIDVWLKLEHHRPEPYQN